LLTISNSTVDYNLAIGGDGGSGGNGLGGGFYVDATSSLTLLASAVVFNEADGGAADSGATDGNGVGGGLYITPGGIACADALTATFANDATTSNDDVFGTLGGC
jgi:hypothetical protein